MCLQADELCTAVFYVCALCDLVLPNQCFVYECTL